MPIPRVTRVNPLDLQKNIAIGVALPFNAPGVFKSTYTTKDQIKSNLVNLLLTSVGERVMNPNFGCELKRFVFEGISENILILIFRSLILFSLIPSNTNLFSSHPKFGFITLSPTLVNNKLTKLDLI